jgi:hypothetical protein
VQLLAYKHGKLRWNVQIVDGALESPNWNLGSNFAIHRYDMNGDYISPAVLHLSRQSGQMDLSGNLNVECGGGSPGRLWVRGDHVVGGTTYLYQHLTANAGATINGVQNTNGNIVATNGNYHGFLGSHHPGSSCVGMYNWNNVLYFTNSDGNGVVSGNPRAYLDGAGNFTMAGTTFRGYNGMYIYVDGGTTQFVQNSSMWRWEYAAGSGHMSYVRGHDNAVLFQVQPDGIAFATSAATVGWLGIQYRSYSSSWFGMGWNGFVNMYIDGTYIGDMATTGWVNGNFYTAGTCDGRYLSIWGGDVHGDLRTLGTFRAYRGAYFMTENLGDSFSLWGNSGGRVLQFSSDGWKLHWDPPSGGSLLFWSWDGRAMSWTDPSGNFHCRGELYKYDTSDERVKRDVVPYEHGLAELIQLEPVRYRFNGLGGSIDDDVEKIGLIAQRVREHLPECVFPTRGQPHNPFGPNPDDRLPDQLSFNDGPLIHAVINALKTINARLTALEQRFA